jgi:AcrR family transcriptional regulator
MSPRPYQMGRRQAQIDDARRRVLDAARAVLAESVRYTGFTVDAVAKQAGVARATVYYQFGSKTGLLEALCDALAEAGGMEQLGAAFAEGEPDAALDAFIVAFATFWDADRLVMRRLRALAPLDPDVGRVIAGRDEMRRRGLEVLVGRLPPVPAVATEDLVRILSVLTGFEVFDGLAGEKQHAVDVAPTVSALVRSAVNRAASGGGSR